MFGLKMIRLEFVKLPVKPMILHDGLICQDDMSQKNHVRKECANLYIRERSYDTNVLRHNGRTSWFIETAALQNK